MIKRQGRYTVVFEDAPSITGFASVAGKKESQGPLGKQFDKIIYDAYASQKTWEQAESVFQREALSLALQKAGVDAGDIDFIFAGDLLNQCISSSYGLKGFDIPYLGQYGACSTMVQGLILAAVMVNSRAAQYAACVTSSHFCAAERQYRFPLEYGGQRTPTAQWTATAAGSCIVCDTKKGAPKISAATVGRIIDLGITDANNMGAAMAPAAAQTLLDYFADSATSPQDYNAIYTGDLGQVGTDVLYELTRKQGVSIEDKHRDCGMMIFDAQTQDVHAGGSGCGCAAGVLCAHVLPQIQQQHKKDVLFIATGALMSPTSCLQGQSIPCVAHLVRITA